jgi:hypothetical protein
MYDDYQWTPIFDSRVARDGKQLFHWPVGLTDEKLICVLCKVLVRYINNVFGMLNNSISGCFLLKSGDKHPLPPKVIMSEAELKLPMLLPDLRSVQLEQK